MKTKTFSIVVILLFLVAMVVPVVSGASSNEKIPVIIGFKNNKDPSFVKANGGDIKYQYNSVHAIAANIPEQAITALRNNPNVEYVELDEEVHIQEQDLPWGVDRVEADLVYSSDPAFTGDGVKVVVIDTGICYTHPDLASNYVMGYDIVNSDTDPMDDNGHGTHVAGTIAAADNSIGVVGVAPEAELYAFKALDSQGSGYTSDIVAGIDWAIDNDMDVISMSIGGGYSRSMEKMCSRAYDAGIVLVAAAGNDANAVDYPAAYDTVIAVSATDSDDSIADFSDRGEEVELAAPGVSILSTYLNDEYDTMSGTSMATPHVSGVVALLLSSDVSGTSLDLDADGVWDPEEVRLRLQGTADASMINDASDVLLYGSGLVDASAALSGMTLPDNSVTALQYSVSDVALNEKAGGKFVWGTVSVTVTDEMNDLVEGAIVQGQWTINGVTGEIISQNTDVSGTVTFESEKLREPSELSFGFEVLSVYI